MEHTVTLTSLGTRICCHVVAILDLLLEPYFLYLVIRCSYPSMSTYRWFLVSVSVCNMSFTLIFGILWSMEATLRGLELCLPSTYFPNDFVAVFLVSANVFLFGQLQLLLAMLFYAAASVVWPYYIQKMRQWKAILFLLIFTAAPSILILPNEMLFMKSDICLDLTPRLSLFTMLLIISGFITAYTFAAVFMLSRIDRFLRGPTSTTCPHAIKLVKTVRRNFVSLMFVIMALDIVPMSIVIGTFAVFSSLKSNSTAVGILYTIVSTSVSGTSVVSTLVTIYVTKPFSTKTVQIIRAVQSIT
ncbi:hypothetical protein QR680_010625 [Steinernema hermaphroditum]|uniref:Uncharacterized protein n=1 Tax=Steinernema hermaphroditum TaxID=289476 RepID=A0AA39MC43_9BILA|nr:hypothetical protein QR680_010625 [Steinernema hermaphroditum]